MVGPISGSLSRQTVRIFVICAAAAVLACASNQSPYGSADPGTGVSDEKQVLSQVDVERVGDETQITLAGLDAPAHSEFALEDENVVVIDLPGVELAEPTSLAEAFGDPGEQVSVYDGLVDQVSTSVFEGGDGGPVTRVEVALATLAEYDVEPGPNGLVIRVRAAGELADDGGADGGDPWATTESVDEETAAVVVETVPPSPATILQSVTVDNTSNGLLIHLVADGIVSSAETFLLNNPDRLVVDLPGMMTEVESNNIDVGTDQVVRVRVGAHADKVRVVVDGGPGADGFQGKRVVPVPTGLFLTVGSGADLDDHLTQEMAVANATTEQMVVVESGFAEDTLEVQSDEMAAPSSADPSFDDETAMAFAVAERPSELAPVEETVVAVSPTAEVYGIQYDSSSERDRIAILSDQVIEYVVLTPDPDTVVISIENAMIAKSAGERIIPKTGGPVSLITSFQQPDVPGQEVRVVLKRAADLEPTVTRRGSVLFVDFANTGVAAAPPPAFVEGEPSYAAEEVAANTEQAVETMAGAEIVDDPTTPEAAMVEDAPMEDTAVAVESETGADPMMASIADEERSEDDYVELPELEMPASVAQEDDTFDAAWNESEAAPFTGGGVSIGAAAPASLEPPAAVEILAEGGLIDGKEYKGRRISLDFKDVEVADVLRLIAEVSDLNIIAGDEVQGVITIRLVDVPWDQALDVILLTKGLGFVRVGNVLRIAPADILKVEEEVRLQERRNKEKLEDLEVKLQPVNYASVADVSKLVKRLLSARGTVNVDERTNTVIIKDISSVIDEATALIKAVDTQTPQVMIEAKIVEASLDFARELGSAWSVGTQPLVDGFDSGSDPRTDLGGDNFKFKGDNSVVFSNPITSTPTSLLSLGAFLLDEKMSVDVQIAAAEATGEGKVISSPRIVTLDNREAIIEQGVSIPFQTFEGGDAKLEFIDAVLSLKVTPHITTDRSIIMSLEVTRNAPDASVPTPTGSPAIAKNQAKTETLVKDGQTLVIGGIYTIDKTERETRVPYLHRIPVIGAAFKSRELSDKRKELLIFVTPRIIVNPALANN